MTDTLISALLTLLQLQHMSYLLMGVIIGLVVGILPGLSGVAGFSLVLPFIYGMDPVSALALLIGLTAVTSTSDTFTSVLMGIPGSSAAQATVLDGFPLAKKGQAARALSAAFSASLIGGLIGAAVLTIAIYFARPLILAIGFGEQLMLLLLGLSMVGLLTGKSPLKGLAACGLGLMIGGIGGAPATGEWRLAFGQFYLADGVPLIVLALGIYAIPEIIDLLRRQTSVAGSSELGAGWGEGLRDTCRNWGLVLRCSGVGCLVGALPGLGGAVVDWIAYGHAVQTSRDKSGYGKGDIRGVIAPESANNAKEGGALLPTLLFGIPGSGAMAVLLGGMILIGIQPGIGMVQENLDLTYSIIWSLALANVLGAGICFAAAPQIAKLTKVNYTILGPVMIVMVIFAAFQASRQWGDIVALIAFGILGVYLRRFGWARPALLIGFVLSSRLEVSLYQAVQVYGFSIFERPLVWIIGAITVTSATIGVRSFSSTGAQEQQWTGSTGFRVVWPQIIFTAVIGAFCLAAVIDAIPRSFLSKIFPLSIGILTTLAVAGTIFLLTAGGRASSVFHDEEMKVEEGVYIHSAEHYLLWLLGLMAGMYMFGFLLSVASFLIVFLHIKAGAKPVRNVLIVSSVIAVLHVISRLLVVSYPGGLAEKLIGL